MLRSSVVRIRFPLVLVGVLIGFSIGAADAKAQGTTTFTVTNLNDAGSGSLRQAIIDANASTATSRTITFDVPPSGTINLISALPDIDENVTINGNTAANLTVNGSGASRIFRVGANKTTVQDLALKGAPLAIGTGASLSFNTSENQEFNSAITDGGQLIKEGNAALTLRGENTYSGGTLVSAGTLIGDATSLQRGITNNALVVFDQPDDGNPDNDEYAGAITGTGAVEKTGAGDLEFTGTNTYAGGTTVSAGSLRGDANALQGNIEVASGAEVIFEHDGPDDYSGNLTGAGGFTKEGGGTLTLSGVNTISGPSNLNAGHLEGGYASIPRNLTTVTGTSVTFDHDDDGTYSGSLKGAGDFIKLGTGTLTLSGANTISGLASLDAGALRGGPAGIPLNLSTAAGTSVIFNHTTSGTYAGVISGPADVTKSGSGTLTLSQANTYTGLTSITGGRLNLNGSLAGGGVDVGANATLSGTGSVAGPVTVSGTVAPGNSIGDLTVGPVVFEPDSVFAVEVDYSSGTADHLLVMGEADLSGASLQVDPGSGSYSPGVDIPILTADSILNDFASFEDDFAFLKIEYTLTATTVGLEINYNGAALSVFAQTPNQLTIATELNDALEAAQAEPGPSDIETVFDGLYGLTESQVPGALDAMTGETLSQFATARLATAQRFGRALDARIRDYQWNPKAAIITAGAGEASHASADFARSGSSPILGVAMLGVGPLGAPRVGTSGISDPLLRTWIDGSGIFGDVDGNANESAFDYTIWGGSLGADLQLADHWVLGLAGGYANTDLDFSSRPGDAGIDTYQGALYAGYVDPRFHLGVSGRYAYNDMDGKRDIAYGLNRTAKADPDGDDYGARFEGGFNLLDIGGFVFQPTASVDYTRLDQDGYTESGAGSLNLAVEDNDLDSLVLGVGMRVHGSWQVDDGLWIVPELHGRWLHEFLDTDRLIEAQLVSGGGAFQIQGAELPRDSGSVGVAWSVITDSAWSVIGSYDAILNEDLVQHVGSITLSFEW